VLSRCSSRFSIGGRVVLAVWLALGAAAQAQGMPTPDTRVTVGSPPTPFSQNKQNEPAVAIDANNPTPTASCTCSRSSSGSTRRPPRRARSRWSSRSTAGGTGPVRRTSSRRTTATRTYGTAVWNDVRNGADCPAIDTYRQALHDEAVDSGTQTAEPEEPRGEEERGNNSRHQEDDASAPVAPPVQQSCPPNFGESDIYGISIADPTP
jgi:hypothetical protein